MDFKVYAPDNQGDEFYARMGPYFASRQVRKELPYLCNSPTTHWVLLYDKEDLVGFGAYEYHKNNVTLNHAYVIPEHRGKGVYSYLIEKRMDLLKEESLPLMVAIRHPECVPKFTEYGFNTYKTTKNYTFMKYARS